MASDVAAALRPLTEAEAATTAAHPLPDGVPDAEVNKFQLAHALDVSENTLGKWMQAADFPVESVGTNGRSYSFRLSLVWAWRRAREGAEQARRLQAEGAAEQMRLALIGPQSAAGDRAKLSSKEQADLLALEYRYMQAARLRGELLDAEETAEEVEAAFAAIRDGLDALPDRAARELHLDGAAIEVMQNICDDILAAAARKIQGVIGDNAEADPS